MAGESEEPAATTSGSGSSYYRGDMTPTGCATSGNSLRGLGRFSGDNFDEDLVGASICYVLPEDVWDAFEAQARDMLDAKENLPYADKSSKSSTLQDGPKTFYGHLTAEVLRGVENSGMAFVVFRTHEAARLVELHLKRHHEKLTRKAKKTNIFTRLITGRARDRSLRGSAVEPLLAGQELIDIEMSDGGTSSMPTRTPRKSDMERLTDATVTAKVSSCAENFNWRNASLTFGEVWSRVLRLPGQLLISVMITFLFFMPLLYVGTIYSTQGVLSEVLPGSFAPADIKLFGLKILGCAIYGSSNGFVQKQSERLACSVGCMVRDGEDILALVLSILTTITQHMVCLYFMVTVYRQGFEKEKMLEGCRLTWQESAPEVLSLIIFPCLIVMKYVTEPFLEYLVPEILRGFVLPKFKERPPGELGRELRFQHLPIVAGYADLIVSTTVCSVLSLFITRFSWKMPLINAVCLTFRYLWLTMFCPSTQLVISTTRLWRAAVFFWSIPTGILAAAIGWWFMRDRLALQLGPVGLPNVSPVWPRGPTRWLYFVSLAFGLVHVVVYMVLIACVAVPLGRKLAERYTVAKSDLELEESESLPYTEASLDHPADFFNTNLVVVMASLLTYGDKGLWRDDWAVLQEGQETVAEDERREHRELRMRLRTLLPRCVRQKRAGLVPFEVGNEHLIGEPFCDYAGMRHLPASERPSPWAAERSPWATEPTGNARYPQVTEPSASARAPLIMNPQLRLPLVEQLADIDPKNMDASTTPQINKSISSSSALSFELDGTGHTLGVTHNALGNTLGQTLGVTLGASSPASSSRSNDGEG